MIAVVSNSFKSEFINNVGSISVTLSTGENVGCLYIKLFANNYRFFFDEEFIKTSTLTDIQTLKILCTKYLNQIDTKYR